MKVIMLTKWSPARGQKLLQAGQVVDVEDEVALDMIQRGIAQAVRGPAVERAVGAAQAG